MASQFDGNRDLSSVFVLESKLSDLYECKDKLEKALIEVGRRRVGTNKRQRVDHAANFKLKRFTTTVRGIGSKYTGILENLFELLTNFTTYDKIANDFIQVFHSTKSNFVIQNECYHLAMRCLIRPIISQIMDEFEISRSSTKRQERRIYMIKKFLDVFETSYNSEDANSSDNSNVLVCSPEANNSDHPEPNEDDNSNRHRHISNISNEQLQESQDVTFETILILETLIDALSLHSRAVTEPDVDLEPRVYHFINITYIVDILREYFLEIREKLTTRANRAGLQKSCRLTAPRFAEALDRFDESLSNSLNMLDIENPMSLFRRDMRILCFQIQLLRSVFK